MRNSKNTVSTFYFSRREFKTGYIFVQVCRVDVPERVRHAAGGPPGGQALLPTVHKHPAVGSGGPPHEGGRAHPDVCSDGQHILSNS